MSAQPLSSTVQAWELGARLKEHRTHLGLTAASVAKKVGIVAPNFSAIEAGRRRITAAKLRELVELYELPEAEHAELDVLREQAEGRGWWHDYRELYSEELLRVIGLEAGASEIREYSPEFIPGLLQTSDYARAIIRAGSPYIKPIDVGPRVETRLAQQSRLDGPSPLQFLVLLGEAALRQRVGGPAVMLRQIDHLIDVGAGERHHVRLRVWPFEQGAHPLTGGPVAILTFLSTRLPDLVWQETAITGSLIDKKQVVLEAKASFAEAFDQAPDEASSREIMRRIRAEMEVS